MVNMSQMVLLRYLSIFLPHELKISNLFNKFYYKYLFLFEEFYCKNFKFFKKVIPLNALTYSCMGFKFIK